MGLERRKRSKQFLGKKRVNIETTDDAFFGVYDLPSYFGEGKNTFRIKPSGLAKGSNIDIEIIDAQSLLPFDLNHDCVESVKKTNKLIVIDEDVPGGASAYILQEVLENQNAYQYLDSKPSTLTAKAHRPAYGTDGDYFSKPSTEDVFEKIYSIMHEYNPSKFKPLY